MTVAIIGGGPAGFAVAAAILSSTDLSVAILDRHELPDFAVRYGPSPGPIRLQQAADQVDAVLGDPRATFHGSVVVDDGQDRTHLAFEDLRRKSQAVVVATGAPTDADLGVPGGDVIGITTLTHLHAMADGSADASPDEFDPTVDSAVLVGSTQRSLDAAQALRDRHLRQCRVLRTPEGSLDDVADGIDVVEARPIGIVGRHRARALRVVTGRDHDGMIRVTDLRAQLIVRPERPPAPPGGLDVKGTVAASQEGRALRGGHVLPGVYVGGWAGRIPDPVTCHEDDARQVAIAIQADLPSLLPGASDLHRHLPTPLEGWSAAAAVTALLDRHADDGSLPTADYDELLGLVDED